MAVGWSESEREKVAEGLHRYPAASGRCAALARIVFRVGSERDSTTRGRQVTPAKTSAARFVVPKLPDPPQWWSHTYVETHLHAVDAMTGTDGCPAGDYLEQHWEHAEHLEVRDVDVDDVDPGIQG